MDFPDALQLGRDALWMTVVASAPILILGLVVGLAIAFFQAVTQLQEQTLTFVPKIAAMIVAAALFTPWIAEQVIDYAVRMFSSG